MNGCVGNSTGLRFFLFWHSLLCSWLNHRPAVTKSLHFSQLPLPILLTKTVCFLAAGLAMLHSYTTYSCNCRHILHKISFMVLLWLSNPLAPLSCFQLSCLLFFSLLLQSHSPFFLGINKYQGCSKLELLGLSQRWTTQRYILYSATALPLGRVQCTQLDIQLFLDLRLGTLSKSHLLISNCTERLCALNSCKETLLLSTAEILDLYQPERGQNWFTSSGFGWLWYCDSFSPYSIEYWVLWLTEYLPCLERLWEKHLTACNLPSDVVSRSLVTVNISSSPGPQDSTPILF